MQVRFLMLNTMCLTSLHNIQQDLISFIPFFSSLLMQMIFFLLLKQTVPNSDTRYFRASVIYIYTNPMVMYKLMRFRHNVVLLDANTANFSSTSLALTASIFTLSTYIGTVMVNSVLCRKNP